MPSILGYEDYILQTRATVCLSYDFTVTFPRATTTAPFLKELLFHAPRLIPVVRAPSRECAPHLRSSLCYELLPLEEPLPQGLPSASFRTGTRQEMVCQHHGMPFLGRIEARCIDDRFNGIALSFVQLLRDPGEVGYQPLVNADPPWVSNAEQRRVELLMGRGHRKGICMILLEK